MTDIQRPTWLPETVWPWEIRTLGSDGDRIAYTDTGSGPILLLVHSGTWSIIWRDLIARLERNFRVIAFDPPSMGLSDDGAGAGIDPTASAVDRLVRELDLQEVTLVLHDLGGPAGLQAASAWPERVVALAAVNCFGWRPDAAPFRAMLQIVGSAPMRVVDEWTGWVPAASATRFGVGKHMDRATRRAYLTGMDRRGRRSFHENMASTLDHDYTLVDAGAAAIASVPILTVFGEHNDPLGFQPRWKALGSQVEQVTIAGGFHFPMCDDPDRVASSIMAWHRASVIV
ncbi:alpha/beta fold hydrolase [Microbacterium sp.]|uniref:alpha/beta fold hydrolase n=1 Tax=Microbacterium sp. TaxID=51671 RepID=UPI003C260599